MFPSADPCQSEVKHPQDPDPGQPLLLRLPVLESDLLLSLHARGPGQLQRRILLLHRRGGVHELHHQSLHLHGQVQGQRLTD